jgi:hypothetical protein
VSRASTAEARALEIEKRADYLKTELGLAHMEAQQERRASKGKLDATESRVEHLSDELMKSSVTDTAVHEEGATARPAKGHGNRAPGVARHIGTERHQKRAH